METKEKKTKGKSANHGTVKDRMNRWISKSPKLEKFVDNTSYFIKHPDKFTEKINEIYNHATSKGEYKTLAEFGSKIRSAYRMSKMALSGEYQGVAKGQVIVGFAAFVYLVSPVDIIPDVLPFIGFVDDAALMLWLIRKASDEVEKFEQWEQAKGIQSVNPAY